MLLQDDAAPAYFISSIVLCFYFLKVWDDHILQDFEYDRVPGQEKTENHSCRH
jgi:hypothetical protein